MVLYSVFENEPEWLKARKIVGGSDAACVMGMNPYKSNIELWKEKTGRIEPPDLSENKLVQYGKKAEAPLRRLFELDYPELVIYYAPFNMWTNDKYPWAHASLDGWCVDRHTSKCGIIEFKTATISGSAQANQWKDDRIPDHYFCQVLHYLAVCDVEFAILTALLKYEIEGQEPFSRMVHYVIERTEDIEEQIGQLMEKERKFAEYVENDTEPPMILTI